MLQLARIISECGFQQLFEVSTYVSLEVLQGNGGCVTRQYTLLRRHLQIGFTTRHILYITRQAEVSVYCEEVSLFHCKHTMDL